MLAVCMNKQSAAWPIDNASLLPCDAMHNLSAAIAGIRCLSVCPSVRLSRSWVAPKPIKISSKVTPSDSHTILVFPYQTGWRYSDGNRHNGDVECKGVWKNDYFRPISRSISETVIVRWRHAARKFVSIEFSFYPYEFSVIAPGASPGETKMW